MENNMSLRVLDGLFGWCGQTYLHGITQDARELKRVKNTIFHDANLSRYFPFLNRSSRIPHLLDRQYSLYGTLHHVCAQKADEFSFCRKELEEYHRIASSRFNELADQPGSSIVLPDAAALERAVLSGSPKDRMKARITYREQRSNALDVLYTTRHRQDMMRFLEERVSGLNPLVDTVTTLENRFRSISDFLVEGRTYHEKTMPAIKGIVTLKEMGAYLKKTGYKLLHITADTYYAVESGLSDINCALSGITPEMLPSSSLLEGGKARYLS